MGKMKTKVVGSDENKDKKEKVHLSGAKGGERIKVIDASPTEEAPIIEEGQTTEASKKAKKVERVRGKKYKDAKASLDHEKFHTVSEAVSLVKKASYSKFDGTMEIHLVMKKVGVSAQVALPHQAGRVKKVEVASEETIEKLKTGKVDFDVLVATADMMPNPKNGTLVNDPKKLNSFSASTVTLKTEKEAPLVHTVVGKVSQKDDEIVANIEAVIKALGGDKQIVRGFIKSTMSPAAKLKIK